MVSYEIQNYSDEIWHYGSSKIRFLLTRKVREFQWMSVKVWDSWLPMLKKSIDSTDIVELDVLIILVYWYCYGCDFVVSTLHRILNVDDVWFFQWSGSEWAVSAMPSSRAAPCDSPASSTADDNREIPPVISYDDSLILAERCLGVWYMICCGDLRGVFVCFQRFLFWSDIIVWF